MKNSKCVIAWRSGVLSAALLLSAALAGAQQNDPPPNSTDPAKAAPGDVPAAKPTLEIYGFGQADAIVDFNQTNPDWYDVVRPSRLPAFPNQFGEDGRFNV